MILDSFSPTLKNLHHFPELLKCERKNSEKFKGDQE